MGAGEGEAKRGLPVGTTSNLLPQKPTPHIVRGMFNRRTLIPLAALSLALVACSDDGTDPGTDTGGVDVGLDTAPDVPAEVDGGGGQRVIEVD